MLKYAGLITAVIVVGCVPSAFAQDIPLWEYEAESGAVGHFEVTPLGSLFVGLAGRVVVLDGETGELLWERTDIHGCSPRRDDPDTSGTNEADGTIRCLVDGMEATGFLADRSGVRFSSIPNSNFGLFELGFRGPDRTSDRYMVLDLDTGETLWESSALSLERTRGYMYLSELNVFFLAGETVDERGLILAVDCVSGDVVWQQATNIIDRFKFLGTPNGQQMLAYGKRDGGRRTVISMGLSDGIEQWRIENQLEEDANNRNVLLTPLGDETAILYITEDGPLRIHLDTGEVMWRASRWSEDPPDRGAARMVFDDEFVYVPNGRNVDALYLRNGRASWRIDDRFRDEPLEMQMLPTGLLIRAREIDLIDPETGRSRWRRRTDRFDEESQVLFDDGAVYVAEKERLSIVDLENGNVERLAEYDLDGDDPGRLERHGESLVLMSQQNVLKMSLRGDLEFHVYQHAPGAGFFEKLVAAIDYALYLTAEEDQQRFSGTANERVVAQQRYDEARVQMLESYPALRERRRDASDIADTYYMFTDTPVDGREGYSLVKVDKASGAVLGRLWTDERSPQYTIDEFSDVLYFRDTPTTIRALQLGGGTNR